MGERTQEGGAPATPPRTPRQEDNGPATPSSTMSPPKLAQIRKHSATYSASFAGNLLDSTADEKLQRKPVQQKVRNFFRGTQTISAFDLHYTPKCMMVTLFLLGSLFLAGGIVCLTLNSQISRVELTYSDPEDFNAACAQESLSPYFLGAALLKRGSPDGGGGAEQDSNSTSCSVEFNIKQTIPAPVNSRPFFRAFCATNEGCCFSTSRLSSDTSAGATRPPRSVAARGLQQPSSRRRKPGRRA